MTTDSISDNNRSTAGDVFIGYQISEHLAVEAGYFDLGKFGFTAQTTPAGSLVGSMKAKGVNTDIVGLLPIATSWSATARAGITYSHVNSDFGATGAVRLLQSAYTENGTNFNVGIGLNYAVSSAFNLRLEASRLKLNDAVNNQEYVSLISVGFAYRFGESTVPAARPNSGVAAKIAPPLDAPGPMTGQPPSEPAGAIFATAISSAERSLPAGSL